MKKIAIERRSQNVIVINQRHGTSAVEIHGQGPSAITSAFQRYKKGKASAFAGALGRGEAKRSDVLLVHLCFSSFREGGSERKIYFAC